MIIIAIGVLLASEAGQAFLGLLIKLAIIGGLLFLGFWIVVIVIGLLSDKGIRDGMLTALVVIMLIAYAVWWAYEAYRKHQRGELTMKNKAKDLWLKNWNESKVSKAAIVFLILGLSLMVIMFIYSLLMGFWQ